MSTKCQICGKTPANGNRVSHANNRTKRRWMPNLQTVRIRQANGNRKKLEFVLSVSAPEKRLLLKLPTLQSAGIHSKRRLFACLLTSLFSCF